MTNPFQSKKKQMATYGRNEKLHALKVVTFFGTYNNVCKYPHQNISLEFALQVSKKVPFCGIAK
jgi:hypothetical protein